MMNNLSRAKFNEFLTKNSWLKRVDTRNVCVDVFGNKYAFCIVQTDKIECRQFYSDCTDVICLNIATNKLYQIPRAKLNIHVAPNRITAKGISAYTAIAALKHAFVPNMVM